MIRVCPLDDLDQDAPVRVEADVPIAVFRYGDEVFALDDTCTHQDASLSDGFVEDCRVECPLHASMFDLRTGVPDGPPARRPVRTHQVVVQDGIVHVVPSTAVPARAPVAP